MTTTELEAHQRVANVAYLVAHSGYLLWSNCISSRTPHQSRTFDRMKDPQIGDLVLETTTYHSQPWDPGGLGELLAVEMEPWYTEDDGTVRTEKVWYVKPFTPREDGEYKVRWTNASFIALPDELRWIPR